MVGMLAATYMVFLGLAGSYTLYANPMLLQKSA